MSREYRRTTLEKVDELVREGWMVVGRDGLPFGEEVCDGDPIAIVLERERLGTEGLGTARRGRARLGGARLGEARRGEARRGQF